MVHGEGWMVNSAQWKVHGVERWTGKTWIYNKLHIQQIFESLDFLICADVNCFNINILILNSKIDLDDRMQTTTINLLNYGDDYSNAER